MLSSDDVGLIKADVPFFLALTLERKMMTEQKSKDPLHGVTLQMILEYLEDYYGWELLGKQIDIRCFNQNPSVKSSLTFLRKTPWAREKVERLYLKSIRKRKS